jgi:hypothetical protein
MEQAIASLVNDLGGGAATVVKEAGKELITT